MCEYNCWVRTPQAAKTETTKQKQQDTTQNFHFMSSVAISVHCCLHWCSHRHLASVSAPYIYPAILHLCSHLSFLHCSSLLGIFVYSYHSSSSLPTMWSLPRLRQGQQAVQDMLKGNIYFLSTDWELYTEPDTGRVWYHNRRLDTAQWEFPINDCAKGVAIP